MERRRMLRMGGKRETGSSVDMTLDKGVQAERERERERERTKGARRL